MIVEIKMKKMISKNLNKIKKQKRYFQKWENYLEANRGRFQV